MFNSHCLKFIRTLPCYAEACSLAFESQCLKGAAKGKLVKLPCSSLLGGWGDKFLSKVTKGYILSQLPNRGFDQVYGDKTFRSSEWTVFCWEGSLPLCVMATMSYTAASVNKSPIIVEMRINYPKSTNRWTRTPGTKASPPYLHSKTTPRSHSLLINTNPSSPQLIQTEHFFSTSADGMVNNFPRLKFEVDWLEAIFFSVLHNKKMSHMADQAHF